MVKGIVGPVAGSGEFQDRAVVDDPIDGRGGCHGVFEYLVPLREDEIGRNQHALSLVPLSQEVEEHLHLLLLLLDIADVSYDHGFKAIQAAHFTLQGKVPFCGAQSLDQTVRRDKRYRMTLLYEFMADSGHEVSLAPARQTECQDILGSLQKMAFTQRR